MVKQAWKVKLHEARSQVDFMKSAIAADFVEVFGVQADGFDDAKRAAKRWLEERGHVVRSINVSAEQGADRTLIVYVANGSVRQSKIRAALPPKR